MLLLSCFSSLSPPGTLIRNRRRQPHYHRSNCSPCSSSSAVNCQLEVGFQEIAAIAQNKVLVAAAVSTAVGQLSKPFTSAFVYGNAFEVKAAVQSGGFPSTHSSAVVAAATSLCLERGFSDSIFGLTVVYAAIVMYDAQGVRREVGKHARTINRVLHEREHSQKDTISVNLKDEEEIASGKQPNATEGIENTSQSHPILYERVGHTELEVMAGAFLGFVVSLTLYSLT